MCTTRIRTSREAIGELLAEVKELREQNRALTTENAILAASNTERNMTALRAERETRRADHEQQRAKQRGIFEQDRREMLAHRAAMLAEAKEQTRLLLLICGRVGDIRAEVRS